MILIPTHLRRVLEAPLKAEHPVSTLGRSLWLYLTLLVHASDQGTVMRTRQRLAEDLAVPEAEIDQWLSRLSGAKLIEIQSPAPFLVLSLCLWPRSGAKASDLKEAAASSAPAEASNEASKQAIINSKHGDEGLGEGEAIANELRALVGDADAEDLRPVIATYPPALVRQVLDRVKSTPSRQIKKSRTALFRFLLKTLSTTPHDHPPAHSPHA